MCNRNPSREKQDVLDLGAKNLFKCSVRDHSFGTCNCTNCGPNAAAVG